MFEGINIGTVKGTANNPIVNAFGLNQVVKNGLALWLDGKSFTNSPPTSTWNDKSGNGNNATTSGFAYTTASGSNGNGGVVFAGDNDTATSNLSASIDINSFTYETKTNILSSSTTKVIIGFGSARWMGITNGKFAYDLGTNTTTPVSIAYGSIQHLVFRVLNGVFDIFINGSNVYTGSSTAFTISSISLNSFIGSYYLNRINYIDRIYNRALTNSEILQNYNASK